VNYIHIFVSCLIYQMDIEFKDQELADLYEGRIKGGSIGYDKPLVNQFIKTIKMLQSVDKIEQLSTYNGLHYEKLKGSRKGYSSVRINQKYRLIFEEIFSDDIPPVVNLLSIDEISNHYD
jgi:proteic killer suppression protein